MKFTNGYWHIKPEMDPHFATQYLESAVLTDPSGKKSLNVLAATKPIRGRGDTLNSATLDVTFSAPRENIIRVRISHFAGVREKGPFFETFEETVSPAISETPSTISFTSGALEARVHKEAGQWQVDFLADGKLLTFSGYHGMAHILKKTAVTGSIVPPGDPYMTESLMLDVGEYIYGLGERFTPYIKNGQEVTMWNADGGTASELAYKNIPFYMTNRGYGVFVEESSDVSFEVASEKVERVQFSVSGESLTYDIIYGGTPKGILELYTALTGRPALPPAWSFGLWLSTSFTTNYDEATVSSFIDGMAERDIPLSVFHFDCFWMRGFRWCDFKWDPDTFPDPEGMLKRYHDKGLHICCWINPYIGQRSELFAEGAEKGYLLKKANGDVWQTDMWQAGMGILDVTNPAARDWYAGKLRDLLRMGVDALKTDFGERIPVKDVAYFDGSDRLKMHNYYTFLYNQMVFNLLKEERGEGEAVLFARSATAGSQQFPLHWGGDNSASYISMAETLRAGLSMSHSGFGFWSHDISGFEQTAPADVYKRWIAFGLLSSHSRLHGSSSYRVPWLFDEESVKVARKFSRLKNRLMPYLYQKAVEAHETGVPMMRPMMLEFPEDPACETLDRQYMLGDKLLVAPVFASSGEVTYYVPEGTWLNILTGEKVSQGWHKDTFDFMSLPLLQRPGTVLPLGGCEERPDYDYTDGLELQAWEVPEGAEVVVKIPDIKGNTVMTKVVKG
ncbi:MAG: alpha-xylosidase [Firmicutes bacterium]|nr:alpha-xylosidase [Bacillota bacterium]